MKVINDKKMPKAGGHYSPCVEHGGVLYISGQLPFKPEDRSMPNGIKGQTKQCLKNIRDILNAAGSDIEDVIMMRVYLAKMNHWDFVNKIYKEFFGDHKPARVIVPTGLLHYGAMIEIEAIAVAK